MPTKIAAHFSATRVTKHAFERLRYCRKCESFTSLRQENCPNCKRKRTFQPVSQMGLTRSRLGLAIEIVLLAAITITAAALAQNDAELYASIICGAALVTAHLFLRARYSASIKQYRLYRTLISKIRRIADGLDADEKIAELDYEEGHYKACYEKLRETGHFLFDDRLRNNKVLCLNRFELRKDMNLELETVVPRKFSKPFNTYLLEVSKVSPELIREHTLDYVLRHRAEIEKRNHGKELLTNITSAALRRRSNFVFCQYLIADYAEFLPRDRFYRLCAMLTDHSNESYPGLLSRVKEIAITHYPSDPEIINLL
ncbi:MAG: hypothetical protein H7X86_06745 [Gorillibacterium sp.]|nr:hypothetical protein [Gorillibacterium sp.]